MRLQNSSPRNFRIFEKKGLTFCGSGINFTYISFHCQHDKKKRFRRRRRTKCACNRRQEKKSMKAFNLFLAASAIFCLTCELSAAPLGVGKRR